MLKKKKKKKKSGTTLFILFALTGTTVDTKRKLGAETTQG
jgi:hypothetical protein